MIENKSGVIPLDVRCLVLPDPVEEKIGNLFIPDAVKEKEEWKRQRCTLLAYGASAFAEWSSDKPEPGDRVFVAQYSGSKIEVDGEMYWLINDSDIIGKLEA